MTEDVHLTTPSLIAGAMNSHFVLIGKTLADKISSVASIVLPTSTMSLSQPAPVFNLNHVDEDTVLQHFLSLKTNKAIGLDFISARLLKYGASAICRSVTNSLNLSISSGKFPNVWKCSKVTALFKCGNRSNPANYCPFQSCQHLVRLWKKLSILNFTSSSIHMIYSPVNSLVFDASTPLLQLCLILQMRFY